MSPGGRRGRRTVAAGGVVYRGSGSAVEVVLVGRSGEGLWALPKGRPEPGESLPETARREVEEETGLRVEIVRPVGELRYVYTTPGGIRISKVVHHYLMTASGGDTEHHDDEYDLVEWVPARRALGRLSYDNERDMLRHALEFIALERARGGSEEAAG